MSYHFWIDSIFHGHGVQGNHVDSGEANSPSVSGNDDWRKKRYHTKGEREIMDDIIDTIWGKMMTGEKKRYHTKVEREIMDDIIDTIWGRNNDWREKEISHKRGERDYG